MKTTQWAQNLTSLRHRYDIFTTTLRHPMSMSLRCPYDVEKGIVRLYDVFTIA